MRLTSAHIRSFDRRLDVFDRGAGRLGLADVLDQAKAQEVLALLVIQPRDDGAVTDAGVVSSGRLVAGAAGYVEGGRGLRRCWTRGSASIVVTSSMISASWFRSRVRSRAVVVSMRCRNARYASAAALA